MRKHTICNEPGCRQVCTGRHCDKHRIGKKSSPRTERDRFLDTAAWRKLSRWKLSQQASCEICGKNGLTIPATEVDHIEPRSTHPHLALSAVNLQSLCRSCHSRKTNKGL